MAGDTVEWWGIEAEVGVEWKGRGVRKQEMELV